MCAKFYDKNEIEIEKQVQSLNECLDSIRQACPKEVEHIRQGLKIFNNYDDKVRARVADLLAQENRWMKAGIAMGTTFVALAIWEMFQNVKIVLRWVGAKSAQQDNAPRSRRNHARNWSNE
jgi:hypothetical protein